MSTGSSPGFLGFRRADGRVGTRNHVLVLCINGLVGRAAARIAAAVSGALLVATPYGRGQYGPDKEAHARQMVGLARNPIAQPPRDLARPSGHVQHDLAHRMAALHGMRGRRLDVDARQDARHRQAVPRVARAGAFELVGNPIDFTHSC